jgi:protein-disulfide isomerase
MPQSTHHLAVVNGAAITEDEVARAAADDLRALEAHRLDDAASDARARLEIMHRALDVIVGDRLIAAEAAKREVRKEDVIYGEIESNVQIPSDEEIERYYEANKARIAFPREQALPWVRQHMTELSRTRLRDLFIRNVKRHFGVKVYLEPVRYEVTAAGHPSRGLATAPVTIVEFSDFDCSDCRTQVATLKAVEDAYTQQLRVVFRQFPLTSHPRAQKAAQASLCAHEQGRFWEFHDALFGHPGELNVDGLKRWAVQLKLETAAFNACLDAGTCANAVKKDIEEGRAAGVTGTPTMFINGRRVSGYQPYADLKDVIDDELQRIGGADQS